MDRRYNGSGQSFPCLTVWPQPLGAIVFSISWVSLFLFNGIQLDPKNNWISPSAGEGAQRGMPE
jgi:hypothetical protein